MEMILLFFCLTSVVITSVIVAIEIGGDKSLSKQSYKGEMNTINFLLVCFLHCLREKKFELVESIKLHSTWSESES